MKKGLIKALTLIIAFTASLILFNRFMYESQEDMTTEMAAAKLPVVTLYSGDLRINELYGYTEKMDATGMRDTITPVSDDEEIPIQVKTYGSRVDAISFEIRSMDGERLVSDGNAAAFQEEDGLIQTDIPVQNLLEQGKEYILILKLEQDGETCYYYTRIEEAQEYHVTECVEFAEMVNDITFSETQDALSSYWEANEEGDNSTLQTVTIHSSLGQAGWGDLECSRLTAPVPSVKEMNSSYNVVVLNYVVTANTPDGGQEYYNIEEYYRVRYTDERMYLLNFERTMNRIFRAENHFLYDTYLQLGIRSADVEYLQNEAGTVTCFVQEGDLWSYNQASDRIASVFSFRGREGIDARENLMQHGIRILAVDESGSIDYVVYGYMNRGRHEGRTGISVMHYDGVTNMNEELMFAAFDKSYEVLRSELGALLYKNADDVLYLFLNGTIYQVDLPTLEVKELASSMTEGTYAASASNRYIVWRTKGDGREAEEITVMDLETQKRDVIRAKEGLSFRILGFLQEDFVYGVAADKHRRTSAAGVEQSPMYSLRIIRPADMSVLKEYHKKGYYIDRVEFADGVLTINRLTAADGGYQPAQQDSIVNRNQEEEAQEVIHTTVTDVKQTQVQLTLAAPVPESETEPVYIAAKLIMENDTKEAALKSGELQAGYYAYAKGHVQLATEDLSAAIRAADEAMGVVVDAQQSYIWKRARKTAQQPLNVEVSGSDEGGNTIAQCLSAMLKSNGVEVHVGELLEKGDSPQEILDSLLPDKKILDLSGCSVEQIFYYINQGTPVFAAVDTDRAALVTGYDSANVWLYDPLTGGERHESIEDANTMFQQAGGRFLAVL